jgi:hypothetical protein
MDLFLSLLDIQLTRSSNHLGACTGWTLRYNDEMRLWISGGVVGQVEYLDSIKFGKNLSNPYNDFVNPFYLWDILSDDGRRFFFDYYKDDIDKLLVKSVRAIEQVESKLSAMKNARRSLAAEISLLNKNKSSITTQ